MLERLRNHLAEKALIPEGGKVLVGYSGGADSTCLVHLLSLLEVDFVAAHLHHGQRAEADQELEMCRSFAGSTGAEFISGQADVPRMARELGIGLEEAGRRARYAFFDQAARHYECDRIATAHTRSDHIETILLHLTRGSGLTGLAGIPEQRGNLVRPMLHFTREETRQYCIDHSLPFHDDPANADLSFSRARMRHKVLPELRVINPAVDEAIARMAELVSAEDRFLNGVAAAALEKAVLSLNGALEFLTRDVEVAFDRTALAALPAVVLRRSVRLAVETLGARFDSRETEAFEDGLRGQESGAVTAQGGEVIVEWSADRVHIRAARPEPEFRHSLTLPGETICDEMGWKLTAWGGERSQGRGSRTALSVELDPSSTRGALYFRSAQANDKMRPLGFDGHRKLSDILAEARLTQAARRRLPIVCDLLGPIWAPGACIDERVRPKDGTERVWVLRFEPVQPIDRHNEETDPISRA